MIPAFQVLGGTDCELIGVSPAAQPVAMVTSLAYVIAGVAVAARAGTRRQAAFAYGVVLALVGAGSIAYHGPQPAWARWAHDLPIAVLFLIIATVDLHRLGRLRGQTWIVAAVIGAVLLGGLFAAAPEAAGPVTGAVVLGAAAAEVAVYARRRRSGIAVGARSPWFLAAFVPLALLAYALGRTGSPLCDPDGLLQIHGLWHVLSAAALSLWPAATGLLDGDAGRDLAGTVHER